MRSQRRAVTLCQAPGTSLRRPQRAALTRRWQHGADVGGCGPHPPPPPPPRAGRPVCPGCLGCAKASAGSRWAPAPGAAAGPYPGESPEGLGAEAWAEPPRGPREPSHAPRCPGSGLPLRLSAWPSRGAARGLQPASRKLAGASREVPEPRRSLRSLAPCLGPAPCPGPSVTAGCSGAQRARGTCLLSGCFQVTMRAAALTQLLSWILEWSFRGIPAVSCHRPLPRKKQHLLCGHWSTCDWRSSEGLPRGRPLTVGASRGQNWLQHAVEALLTCPGPHLCPQAVLFQLPRGILLLRLGGTPQVRRCRSSFPWGLLVAFCAS